MNTLRLRSNAKINLFLDIVGKRTDGYHLIQSVMQSISLYDELEVSLSGKSIEITCNDFMIPVGEGNTCFKAAKYMIERYNIDACVHISISKTIPPEAGMAGGSGNAAAVIYAMDRLLGLNLSLDELRLAALHVGADVPFCLQGGTALSEGIGEKLYNAGSFSWENILIVKPAFSMSTADVYGRLSPDKYNSYHIEPLLESLAAGDNVKAAALTANTLEFPVVSLHPEINEIKKELKKSGAVSALMTGSGSAVFGLFPDLQSSKTSQERLKSIYPFVCNVSTKSCGIEII